MDTSKRYNGWTNYETWAVNLWLSNEEPSYRYWEEVSQEVADGAEATNIFTRAEQARFALADRLKAEHEEALPELQGFAGDLLNAALSEVNWGEIAEALLEDKLTEVQP